MKSNKVNQHPNINILREKLSKFMSPYSDTSKIKRGVTYTSSNNRKYPFIKIVSFGTGSGKTYGALENFVILTRELNDEMRAAGRTYADGLFTNAVFTTPTKNQIKFSQKHLVDMRNEGITPLSIFGLTELKDGQTKLWGGGTLTLSSRLSDYKTTIKKILELMPDKNNKSDDANFEYWHRDHLNLLNRNIKTAENSFFNINRLTNKLERAAAEDKEDIDNELKAAIRKHGVLIGRFAVDVLNNQYYRDNKDDYEDYDDEDEDEDDEKSSPIDNNINPIKTSFNNNNFKQKTNGYRQKNSPMSEDEVYEHIFAIALKKLNFDDSVSHTTAKCNDWWVLLATLKMDILRIFAPLNYCCYCPSLLCMTTDKFRMTPDFYRLTYRTDVQRRWTKDAGSKGVNSNNFSELFGGKYYFGEPILYQKPGINNQDRVDYLERTLFKIRGWDEVGKKNNQ